MFQLRVVASFAAGHRLLNSGTRCESPHGHNYVVEAFLVGAALDHRGMVYDFSDFKDVIETLVAKWDHKFLVNSRDASLRDALEKVDPVAVVVFEDENPTAEAMARRLFLELRDIHGVPVQRLRVWETDKQYAEFYEADPRQ